MTYNFRLSSEIRRRFADLLSDAPSLQARLDGPGPFLVATRWPVNEIVRDPQAPADVAANSHVVLIDLSGAEPKSVALFVKEFKVAIRKSDVIADRELAPLRPAIVSSLLRMNAAVPFIASAYASVSAGAVGGMLRQGKPAEK
jgi:hypothetical protein